MTSEYNKTVKWIVEKRTENSFEFQIIRYDEQNKLQEYLNQGWQIRNKDPASIRRDIERMCGN